MEHTDDIAQARSALKTIPVLKDVKPQSITRLGGLTNLVFRVDGKAESYCMRIPGKGTEEYINRKNEAQAAHEAAKAGVSPEVLYFSERTGILVTRFLDHTLTMSPENFRNRKHAPARAGKVFRKLHASGAQFSFRFELFTMIDDYLKVLAGKSVEFPPGYHDVLKESGEVRAALAAHSLPLVACHCDPLCENFLDTGERMWIVDWEYSGMNDPLWDLGDLSVEGEFNSEQEEEMIRAYFDGPASDAELGRIVIYKAMCDLLWTLWGLIQFANKNTADDFWAYSLKRFDRCKALMGQASFPRHVHAVLQG